MRNTSMADKLTQMQNQKGKTCISVIVPVHSLNPLRRSDPLTVSKTLDRVKMNLRSEHSKEAPYIIEQLQQLYEQVDFNHSHEGLGFFVSEDFKLLYTFLFPVEEKVIIGDSFEIRDILYQLEYSPTYWLLSLTEKDARLYRGKQEFLEEIRSGHFPMQNSDIYEYTNPSRGSSYTGNAYLKAYEKDKSISEQIHYAAFLRKVDKELAHYIKGNYPVLIAGVQKQRTAFRTATKHEKLIVGELHGNFTHTGDAALGRLAWPLIISHLNHVKMKWLSDLEEKLGTGLAVTGLTAAWKAAHEGRGLHLLVEKDYRVSGFTTQNSYQLKLSTRQHGKYRFAADAVDDLIEVVLSKGGNVAFYDTGKLMHHEHLALITRY